MLKKEEILIIKSKVDCRELIKHQGINFNGQNISCLNHSHPDKNPSMTVYRDHAFCFGCGCNLDAIGIIQNIHNMSFKEASNYLATKYNFNLISTKRNKNSSYKDRLVNNFKPEDNSKKLETNIIKDTSIKEIFWEIIKPIQPTKHAIDWLNKRKISVETAWKLGCRDITPVLKRIEILMENNPLELLKENNFVNDKGNIWYPLLNKIKGYDDYSGLIIPLFNSYSKIHSFRWRFFNPIKKDNTTLKVLGQPSCEFIPIGLNFAEKLEKKEDIYICEGEPDWLSLSTLFDEKNIKNKTAIGLCVLANYWDSEWTKVLSQFKKIYICLHDTNKAKKVSDIIQNDIINLCQSEQEKKYWEKNIFEKYFLEKNDINDNLVKNEFILENIEFKIKEFKQLEPNENKINISPMNVMEVCNNSPPELEFVFPGLLRGIVGSVVSAGGTGKTMWAIQTCVSIACGMDILGHGQIVPGKVVLLSGEDPEKITAIRLHKIGSLLNKFQIEKLNENLKIYSISGHNQNIFDQKWFQWIKKVSEDSKLVVIDTLRVFHNSEENDSGKMSELIKILGTIAKECNTSILFLHHTNKNSSNNSTASDQQASRGSSVLTDNIKLQINLVTMTQADSKEYGIEENDRKMYVKYVYSKMNYGSPIPDRWLKREAGGILKPIELKKLEDINLVAKSIEQKNNEIGTKKNGKH